MGRAHVAMAAPVIAPAGHRPLDLPKEAIGVGAEFLLSVERAGLVRMQQDAFLLEVLQIRAPRPHEDGVGRAELAVAEQKGVEDGLRDGGDPRVARIHEGARHIEPAPEDIRGARRTYCLSQSMV